MSTNIRTTVNVGTDSDVLVSWHSSLIVQLVSQNLIKENSIKIDEQLKELKALEQKLLNNHRM